MNLNKENYFCSVVGKSFEYWKKSYDDGTIEKNTINLQLVHLKNAIDQGFITMKEYFALRQRITVKYSRSCTDFKPCTLMDFGRMLRKNNLINNLETNQPIKINDESKEKKNCHQQKHDLHVSENISEQNEGFENIHPGIDKELESTNNKVPKTSKKRRKRKKKLKNNPYQTVNTDLINDDVSCINSTHAKTIEVFEDKSSESTVTVSGSKDPVKIFVRTNNKCRTVSNTSPSSPKMTLRQLFSKLLKEYKQDALNQL